MKKTFMLPHLAKMAGMANWPEASVPTLAQANDYIPWICEVPCDYLLRDDPEGMAECSLLVQEYLGLDSLIVNLDVYNFEAEAIGAPINFYADHMPDLDRKNYLIKSPADLEKIKWPGLDSGRFPYLMRYLNAYKEYVGIPETPCFCGPWSLAGNLYGLDNLIVDTMEDPGFVKEFLNRIVEDLHTPMFRDLKREIPELDTLSIADAFASPPMVNMDIIRTFIEPALKHELDSLGIEGMKLNDVGIWGVSRVPLKDREEFIDFTADIVNAYGNAVIGFDPDTSELGPKYFRDYADKKGRPLLLGVSTSFLQRASVAEAAEYSKHYVLTGKQGITPLMFGVNNIAPGTPIENIQALMTAAEIYGAPGADENTPFAIPEKESFADFLKNKMRNNDEGYTFKWLERSALAEKIK